MTENLNPPLSDFSTQQARAFIPLTATGETQPALYLTPFELYLTPFELYLTPFELYLSNVAVLPFGVEVDGDRKPESAAL